VPRVACVTGLARVPEPDVIVDDAEDELELAADALELSGQLVDHPAFAFSVELESDRHEGTQYVERCRVLV
jgi:hypothetical protein